MELLRRHYTVYDAKFWSTYGTVIYWHCTERRVGAQFAAPYVCHFIISTGAKLHIVVVVVVVVKYAADSLVGSFIVERKYGVQENKKDTPAEARTWWQQETVQLPVPSNAIGAVS
ncbi:hypothetical protein F4803DRAFT_549092 [Xylaria telfairii]|nr:hypothetical protein F4803DRAFT_549092 [Xylaria telfairii]